MSRQPPGIGLHHAVRGLGRAFRTQRNVRIEAACAVAAIAAAAWLDAPLAPILLSCGLVLVAELVNTATEAAVDLASPDAHPAAGASKDVAAAAVLVAAGTSVLVGLVVLGPPLLDRLAKGTP